MRFPDFAFPARPLSSTLSLALVGSVAAAVALAGCGSDSGTEDSPADESAGGQGAGGTGTSTGGAAATGGSGPTTGGTAGITWESGPIRPTRYRIDEPAPAPATCATAGNGNVSASEVLLGQTHLTPAGWPLQTVSAQRPLTVAVAAEGSGSSPAITATARLDGEELTICLSGPATLPANRNDLEASTFRGTFPSKWVQPGLEIEVNVAGTKATLTPDVKPENGLTLYVVDADLFGSGEVKEETSSAQLHEFLARLPVSYLDVGKNPFGVWKPTKLLIGARSDGSLPNGTTTSHDAIVVDETPHCSGDDKAANACTLHSGYGTMSGVLSTLDTFREANGVSGTSTWYADLTVALGGGLAGGQRGTGDDTDLTMNHELGHAWGFPHWDTAHTDYPYEGVQRNNGGFGDRWALDQMTGLLLSPICDGLERQSPMQRAGSCVPDGSWFDPYSDYEAARLLRMNLGAADEVSGTVAYGGGILAPATREFVLPEEGGRPLMVWNEDGPGMSLETYDEASNAFVPYESDAWNRVAQAEVPVVMFYGALIVDGDGFFEEPLGYVGNVLESLDPSEADDYAFLYEHRSSDFYWASDLHFRFTLDDDSVITRIYGGEAVLRVPGDSARFAFNLPADLAAQVKKCEVLSRPLGQYSADSQLDDTTTAANYYDAATVLLTWTR